MRKPAKPRSAESIDEFISTVGKHLRRKPHRLHAVGFTVFILSHSVETRMDELDLKVAAITPPGPRGIEANVAKIIVGQRSQKLRNGLRRAKRLGGNFSRQRRHIVELEPTVRLSQAWHQADNCREQA
jgi:hypothetical protein